MGTPRCHFGLSLKFFRKFRMFLFPRVVARVGKVIYRRCEDLSARQHKDKKEERERWREK
jgi:hypothetical protein